MAFYLSLPFFPAFLFPAPARFFPFTYIPLQHTQYLTYLSITFLRASIWSVLFTIISPTPKTIAGAFYMLSKYLLKEWMLRMLLKVYFTSNVSLDLFLCLWIFSFSFFFLAAYSFLPGSVSRPLKHELRNSSSEALFAENYFNPCLSENTFVFPWLLNNVYIDIDF